MRDGWQLVTIGDVCEIVNGGTPKTNIAEYWDGRHFWITPAEMGKRTSPYAAKTIRKLTDLGLADCSARLLPPLSVILSSRAPIGHLVINKEPMATNQGCKGLIPGKSLEHKFLFYYLASIVEHLNELGTGTTFKELSGGKLKEVRLPLPPIREQNRIVSILDEAFEGIDAAVKNTEKNLAYARDLFESYLNFSLTFDENKVEIRKLATLCDQNRIITYGVIKLGDEFPGGVPCLRTSNVRWLRFETLGVKRIAPSLSTDYKRTILQGGEVLVNVRGTLGGVAAVDSTMFGWNVSREVAVVPSDDNKVNQRYLAYWIARKASQSWLTGVQKGVAYTGINIADLRELPVAIPNPQMQARLVEQLHSFCETCRRLEEVYQQKLLELAILKHTILQKALAGALTARSLEATMPEAAE